MSEINKKLESMRADLNRQLNTCLRLKKEGRMDEAWTALLEAVKNDNAILQTINEEIQRISKNIPGLNKELQDRASKLKTPPQKPSKKKFIVIPKQSYMH